MIRLFCAIFSLFSLCEAATFHALLIADTNAYHIEEGVKQDLQMIKKEVTQIAKYCEYDLDLIELEGSFATFATFQNELERLKAEPEDLILIYLTGHGFRTHTKDLEKNPWANFFFTLDQKGIDFFEIAKKSEEKGAKGLIVIADVCNNYVFSDKYAPVLVPLVSKDLPLEGLLKANYQTLFQGLSGTVLVTAAKSGTPALTTQNGGYFTNAFLLVLANQMRGSVEPDWLKLFNLSQLVLGQRQEFYYEIYLR
jgi:hypothetical protein